MDKNINRIKVALAEKKKTNKWLAEQLDVAQTTVSKWCTNTTQPPKAPKPQKQYSKAKQN